MPRTPGRVRPDGGEGGHSSSRAGYHPSLIGEVINAVSAISGVVAVVGTSSAMVSTACVVAAWALVRSGELVLRGARRTGRAQTGPTSGDGTQ